MSRPPRHPALAGVVASFWVSARSGTGDDQTVLPNGRAQIVVDGSHGHPLLVGPGTRPSTVGAATFSAGVSLGGAGLHALTRMPVHEMLDEVVDADQVWAHACWNRCLETNDPTAVLDVLEHEALRLLRDRCDLDRQVMAVERSIRAGARHDSAVAEVGADRRWFVPAFRDATGLAPKQYARITRFQRSLRAMRSPMPPSLAAIAASHGYADQAHLSREFKEFSGITPTHVHGAASTAHNHVDIGPPRRR